MIITNNKILNKIVIKISNNNNYKINLEEKVNYINKPC